MKLILVILRTVCFSNKLAWYNTVATCKIKSLQPNLLNLPIFSFGSAITRLMPQHVYSNVSGLRLLETAWERYELKDFIQWSPLWFIFITSSAEKCLVLSLSLLSLCACVSLSVLSLLCLSLSVSISILSLSPLSLCLLSLSLSPLSLCLLSLSLSPSLSDDDDDEEEEEGRWKSLFPEDCQSPMTFLGCDTMPGFKRITFISQRLHFWLIVQRASPLHPCNGSSLWGLFFFLSLFL